MFCLLSHNPVLVYLHSSHRLSSCWMVFGGGQSGVSDPSVAQSCPEFIRVPFPTARPLKIDLYDLGCEIRYEISRIQKNYPPLGCLVTRLCWQPELSQSPELTTDCEDHWRLRWLEMEKRCEVTLPPYPEDIKSFSVMWFLLLMLLGMAGGMEMEVEADTGGDAASMDMDLDNVELLDQHPSTISSGRDGRWP